MANTPRPAAAPPLLFKTAPPVAIAPAPAVTIPARAAANPPLPEPDLIQTDRFADERMALNHPRQQPIATDVPRLVDPIMTVGSQPSVLMGEPNRDVHGTGCLGCSTDCYECMGCVKPVWRARVDWMLLSRSDPDSSTGLIRGRPIDQIQFSPADGDLDWGNGPRFTISRHDPSWPDIEFSYFNIDGFDYARAFTGDLIVLTTYIGPLGTANVFYESSLESYEANLRRPLDSWSDFLIGFRYLQLDEFATLNGTSLALTRTVRRALGTDNELIGGQFGFDRCLWDNGGCFKVHATSKFGFFSNNISKERVLGSTRGHASALVSDSEVFGLYQLSKHVSIRGGYHALWLDGVALALNQFEQGVDEIDDSSSIWYHGGSLGLQVIW